MNDESQYRFQARLEEFRRLVRRPVVGYSLLGLSVVISLWQLFYENYNFGDEGDTFAVGWLMSNGWEIYGDVFSHHFPGSYALVALVVKLFGPSPTAIRLSLVVLRTMVFGLLMRSDTLRFPLALTALAWSLLGPLYLGHTLVYQSLSGILILGAFVLSIAVVSKLIVPSRTLLLAIGVFLALAILTDPLMILPAGIVLSAIFLSAYQDRRTPKGSRLRVGASRCGLVLMSLLICMAVAIAWMAWMGNLGAFYKSGIQFNTQIYSKYAPNQGISGLIYPFSHLLDIFNESWTRNTSLFYEWESILGLDQWIFTGLFYRLAILLGALLLFLRGKWLAAVFIYMYAAALLARSPTFFLASPFVLTSLFVASLIVSGSVARERPRPENPMRTYLSTSTANSIGLLTWVVVMTMFGWLQIRGIMLLGKDRVEMTYSATFGWMESQAKELVDLTCQATDARILVYPLHPMLYFLSEIPPASKYHFMTPWVAEIAQEEVLSELGRGPVVVQIDQDGAIWDYPVREYLREVIAYLDQNYVRVLPDIFISPELKEICDGGEEA